MVASIYPLYEFTRQVAGVPSAEVVSLVPPGVEPHDWEPSPQDLTRIRNARMLVYNGAGLEPWVTKLGAERTSSGAVMVRATDGIPLLPAVAGEAGAQNEARPTRMSGSTRSSPSRMVETIRAALARADPAHAAIYAENARAFTRRARRAGPGFRGWARATVPGARS